MGIGRKDYARFIRKEFWFFLIATLLCLTLLIGAFIGEKINWIGLAIALFVLCGSYAYYFYYHKKVSLPFAKLLAQISEIEPLAIRDPLFSDMFWKELAGFVQRSHDKSYSLLLQKQAEINAMQSQINPHFLYNTLDSIRGQAFEEKAPQTCEMVELLSRFLRYTISSHSDMISLSQELDSVKGYMKIQQYRFKKRFSLLIELDEEDKAILSYKIPKLTLQPLVENALLHGLEDKLSGGLIKISIVLTQSRLLIIVSDNGKGIEEIELQQINERLQILNAKIYQQEISSGVGGLALNNVNQRIKLLYGQFFGLTLYSLIEHGTQVEIALPLLEEYR